MHFHADTEATFVAGAVGRDGRIALWDDDPEAGDDADRRERFTVLLADGPREVGVDLVPIGNAIGPLAALPADVIGVQETKLTAQG